MIDLDADPRVTAYVLDELDHDEREIFERDMANADGDVPELIREIEEVAQMLDEAFSGEPEYRMTEQQRIAVMQATDGVVDAEGVAQVDGKVLPWVVTSTISKKDKAVVAEQLRRSGGSRARRAVLGMGIAAGLAAGMFWAFSKMGVVHPAVAADESAEMIVAENAEIYRTSEGKEAKRTSFVGEEPQKPSLSFDAIAPESQIVASSIPNVVGDIEMPAARYDQANFGEEREAAPSAYFAHLGTGGERPAEDFFRQEKGTKGFLLSVDPGITGDWDATLGENYADTVENQFKEVLKGNNQLSTFSIDVDTASYSNVRRMLRAGQNPPASAVRIEEMVNYFNYAYPQPDGARPFSANLEVAACPWTKGNRLVRIGLKGREVPAAERPDSNLVFLIDVSGSMQSSNKLPLLKGSMAGLVENLREQDSVSIVVYAGSSGLVLDATSGALQQEILSAVGNLQAGGSTNGGAGIELAYKVAKENYIKGGVNRVILATDGDFNVGITDQKDLIKMVAKRAKDHIFLTVLGFGTGNLNDDLIEEISNRGNGNSFYIDTPAEGRKVLVEGIGGTLNTIAKDVKIQVEFNPAKVQSYRLIGYENRMLRNRDFNNDKIDAGEVGAGHTVTALYEIVPVGAAGNVDKLKYGPEKAARRENDSPELLTVKMRYKQLEGKKSVKFDAPLVDAGKGWEESSGDFRFAASVAGFGMLLRDSEFKGELNYGLVEELASEGVGEDVKGYRKEFLELVELARRGVEAE